MKHGCLWSSRPNVVGLWAQLALRYVLVGAFRGGYVVFVLLVWFQVFLVLFWLVEVGPSLMMTAQIGTMGIIRMGLRPGLSFSYMLGV